MTDTILALLIAERDKIDAAIKALKGNAAAVETVAAPTHPKPVLVMKEAPAAKKRTMSPEGRKRIAAAAKKRWKLINAGKLPSPFKKKAA